MSRYIDLEELEKRINENIKPETLEEKALIEWCKDECIRQGYAMPRADVVEVRHGVWLHNTRTIADKIYHRWQCSVCARTVATVNRAGIIDYPYCHCGAKMDGERSENGK